MEWAIKDNCLCLVEDGTCRCLSLQEVGEHANELRHAFPSIDFDTFADFVSSLKVVVYTPKDGKRLLPYVMLYVQDFFGDRHELGTIPKSQCVVVSDKFFVTGEDELCAVSKLLAGMAVPGAASYMRLAELRKDECFFLEFIEDDSKCKPIEASFDGKSLNLCLYPYQVTGVRWMQSIVNDGVGCILADEMGLGKTFQIIALANAEKKNGTSLIIAPNALLENWRRECDKLCPQLSVKIYAGPHRYVYYRELLKYDIVVTSYETAVSDYSILGQAQWNLLVLDEAQMIKNHGTKRSRTVRGEFNKRAGIAVTGTPFENRLTDVWSLFDFSFPSFLGSLKDFTSRFSDDESSASTLEKIITPLILRRHVKDVQKDLPETIEVPYALTMNEEEAEEYERIRRQYSENMTKGEGLGLIGHLRKFCALPKLEDASLSGIPCSETSAKFSTLEMILDGIFQKGEKALIFLEYIGAQDAIKESVNAKGVYCEILNGSVKNANRQQVVDSFFAMESSAVLIINPYVGGTGLNITAANHVIFYTLQWNPAIESQCVARAARIGQDKTTFVYRLFYSDTIEEVINDRIERKKAIIECLIKGTDGAEELADINRALSLSPFMKTEKQQ